MKKLNDYQIRNIKAGKGITGALLSGIGSIINAASSLFSGLISTITGFVYMFTDRQMNHTKAEYKVAGNTFTYDDSKNLELEKEKAKNNQEQKKSEEEPKIVKLNDKDNNHAVRLTVHQNLNHFSNNEEIDNLDHDSSQIHHDEFVHWN